MKRVKPRRGFILAGIPAEGADVSDELAKEWIDNGLVTLVVAELKRRAVERALTAAKAGQLSSVHIRDMALEAADSQREDI